MRRVAVVGMFLESNNFARPVPERGFRNFVHLEGDEISGDARSAHPRAMLELAGFYRRMDELGGWEPVPIIVTMSGGGPAEHDWFDEVLGRSVAALREAGPLDAVYLCNHGAMTTTATDDGDGVFFAGVREAVGPQVPIVATLDPHGNVSDLMLESIDLVVAYLTDPHVDQVERGVEAADLLHERWAGMEPAMVWTRLPIVAPNVSLFTDAGPFAELIDRGIELRDDTIANISILGGFAFSDTSKNGLIVIVTGRGDDVGARRVAGELADLAWRNRHRFDTDAMPLSEAVERAVACGRDDALAPIVLSDLGDNTGAGGPTNTLWMLEAMHGAGARGVLIVNFRDRRVVEAATAAGVDATFTATFRGDDWQRGDDTTFEAEARVIALHEGPFVGRRGIVAGKTLECGPMALLELDGVRVIVTSRAAVGNDPIYAEVLGVDLSTVRTIVVKVRSSFPPAYDEFVDHVDMFFVDTPGRTSPVLSRLPFERLPRPVLPLDDDVAWENPFADAI